MNRFRKRVIAGLLTVFLLSSFFTPSTFAIEDGEAEPVSVITDIEEEEALLLTPDEELEETPLSTSAEEPEEACLLMSAEEPEGSTNAESNITITFKITNPNYTGNSDNEETHITAEEVFADSELTFTSWVGRYKVTGTGTLCSYSIPSGTSLVDNGKNFPSISIENIANPTITYASIRTWFAGSLACSPETVFTADTDLVLRLFEDGEDYSLDFVCCKEHSTSIRYMASEAHIQQIGSTVFPLGSCVGAERYPTKQVILATAEYWRENGSWEWQSEWAKEHDWDSFIGWQIKNVSTGAYVPLTSETPITSAYIDPQYGRTIKVYPVIPVTATFVSGGTIVTTRSLNDGDALGDLPTVTPPEGQAFLGWRVQGETSGSVTAETIISGDTTYEAVFEEAAYYTVTFHDVLPDGTESTTVVDSVLVGTRLGAITDEALADGVMRSACIWRESNDPNSDTINYSAYMVMGNVDLYTYTYELVLNYAPPVPMMMKSVVVTPGENGTKTITITAREGSQLEASDFVIEGVDYRFYVSVKTVGV